METGMATMIRKWKLEDAHYAAQKLSREHGEAVVIESPEQPDGEGDFQGVGRWVVEDGDGGMIRSWERVMERYVDGRAVKA